MRLVSTTGPKVILFIFIFFQNTVVSIQLGKIPVLGSRTKIYHYTTHTWTQTTIWHVELHCDSCQVKSNSCFLILQTNNPNNRENLPQMQQILSPTRGITRIFAIFEPFPTYTISSLVETCQITQIFRIGHQLRRFSQIIQSIHYSYRHLLNRQCSEQYWTIIPRLYQQFSTAASTDG